MNNLVLPLLLYLNSHSQVTPNVAGFARVFFYHRDRFHLYLIDLIEIYSDMDHHCCYWFVFNSHFQATWNVAELVVSEV